MNVIHKRSIDHRKQIVFSRWDISVHQKQIIAQVGDMGSIVFPAARALVAWLEKHGGNLDRVRALGRNFFIFGNSGYNLLCMVGMIFFRWFR